MFNIDQILIYTQKMLDEEKDIEVIIDYLRENKYSKTQSIVIVKKLKDIPLDEAHSLVHLSKVWEDVREFDEKLNEEFLKVFMNDN